jgi:hypothetical protein
LKTSRANLTKVFRATQAKLDVASGEVAEMETVSMKEARLINDELKAKLRALDDQKSKAEMILAEEGGVVTSVRGLILNLVKLNETRAIAEAKKRIAAVKKAVLERTNGVNMTALAKEGDELASFGADIIAEEKRHENLTKTRESLHHNAKFETAVQVRTEKTREDPERTRGDGGGLGEVWGRIGGGLGEDWGKMGERGGGRRRERRVNRARVVCCGTEAARRVEKK